MPVFSYKALSSSEKREKIGIIDADNVRAARDKLRQSGLYPTEIVQERTDEALKPTNGSFSIFARGMSSANLAVITRQLATLIKAGLPVVKSLAALEEQAESAYLKKIISQVKDKVTEGMSLGDALALFPKAFPELYINMVKSGEFTGRLDTVLDRLADHMEKQNLLKSKLISKLAYPGFILLTSIGILFILLIFVIPKVSSIFDQLGKNLPLPTKILLNSSLLLERYIVFILLGFILIAIVSYRFLQTPKGTKMKDALMFKLPLLGNLLNKIAVARLSRTLGVLLSSGIPLMKAIDISIPIMDNVYFKDALRKCQERINEGGSMAQTLQESGLFPPMLVHMVSVGERSGELESMLLKVAESYETQAESMIETMMGLIEPMMILLMGGIVGFIVMSILLPIFEINQFIK